MSDNSLDEVRNRLLAEDDALLMSTFFKAMSDPTRLLIINALLVKKWLCVTDIAYILNMSKAAVSHHLTHMRLNKIVRVKRDGQRVYYALCDDHVEQLFALALEHIKE